MLLDSDIQHRAVTACLHLVNATATHWHTKRQATVETATFGSEFVAERIATDQIIDLRYTLMYVGVPIRAQATYLVATNLWLTVQVPTSTLSKKSTLASYHQVRETICCRISSIQLEK